MSKKYTEEQAELDGKLAVLQKTVESDNAYKMDVDRFLKIVQKYTAIIELTPEVLRHFIDKIVVHHREETKKGKMQKVDFHSFFIVKAEMPMLCELTRYKKSFGRHLPTSAKKKTTPPKPRDFLSVENVHNIS